MKIVDRYKLQKNKQHARPQENSALDNYILARVKGHRLIVNESYYQDIVESIAERIVKETDTILKD